MLKTATLLRIVLVLLASALPLAPPCIAQSAPIENLSAFPRGSLEIRHGKQRHHFEIWIADTPTRQEQGLMFVRDLTPTQGMLFPMGKPHVANFWMKNTYIELDMVFIGPDGRIAKVIERARPFSLQTLSSDTPVAAVLEIKGGEAAELGLKAGDAASWSTSD